MITMFKPGAVAFRSAIFVSGLLPATAGMFLATSSGCGPSAPAGFVVVTGSVTAGDAPLTTGTILFSDDAANAGSAPIEADGRFRTLLRPGRVKVAVRAKEGVDRLDEKGNYVPAKSLIPETLGDTKTSGLTIEVAVGMKPVTIGLDRRTD